MIRWRSCLSYPFSGLTEEKEDLPRPHFGARCPGSENHSVQTLIYQGTERENELWHLFAWDCVQPWERILAWRELFYWHKPEPETAQQNHSWPPPSTLSILTPVVCGDLVSGFITTYFSRSNVTGTHPSWTWEQRLHWFQLSECSAA